MRPLRELTAAEACFLEGLLFDLDDTVLDHGSLGRATYAALHDLADAGLSLVAVTGRPGGWGAVMARQWPVLGVVSENGAIAHAKDGARVVLVDTIAADERRRRRERLLRIADEVLSAFPELCLADDCEARSSDVTIDIGEFRRVEESLVDAAVALATRLGARTTRSSVHLHLTLDGDDKASGAIRFLRERLRRESTASRARFAFIGDSENDAACFAAFRTTIAVRNFRGRPTVMPRFVTEGARGAGFVEAAEALIRRRTAPRGADGVP